MKRVVTTPYYFQWLILFFVLHGYVDYIGFIKFSSLVLLIIKLSLAAWLLFLAFRKLYSDAHRSALLVTVLFFCYLFFGALQDHVKNWPLPKVFSSIRMFSLIIVLICIAAATGLFVYKKKPARLTRLLNCLFLIYIIYDILIIIFSVGGDGKTRQPLPAVTLQPVADTVSKPDVYLILLDEYQGTVGLRQYFHYDNRAFESLLTKKGFYVCGQPSGNYSYTMLSMASMLNMRHLEPVDLGSGDQLYTRMAELINNNKACAYFNKLNYGIRNFSPFRLMDQEPVTSFNLVPTGIELITDKTAYSRIVKKLPFGNFLNDLHLSWITNRLNREIATGHERLLEAALAKPKSKQPVFTYIHLMMPHRPYIYDSAGRAPVAVDYKGNSEKDALYLQYLVYTNNRIGHFIEQLQQATAGKAVIMLMSDHGYREAQGTGSSYLAGNTLNAVYLPGRNYRLWNDSVSNVNQFALLFNTLFDQEIPLQKHSGKF